MGNPFEASARPSAGSSARRVNQSSEKPSTSDILGESGRSLIPRLESTGAFWSADPFASRDRLQSWLAPAHRTPRAGLFAASAFLPLPVMTPAALQVESGTRLLGFFRLPFVWLPDDVWGRLPGESLDIYHMRIMLAILAMDLLARRDDGTMTFADCLGGAEPSRQQVAGLSHWFDQGQDDPLVRPIFEDMNERAQRAWSNGYDPDTQEEIAANLASLTAVGCLPLHVLTLASLFDHAQITADAREEYRAERMLDAIHGQYRAGGHDYFSLSAPKDHDPIQLVRWAHAHKGLADALFDQLSAAGLANQRERDAWDSVMAEAISVVGEAE